MSKKTKRHVNVKHFFTQGQQNDACKFFNALSEKIDPLLMINLVMPFMYN